VHQLWLPKSHLIWNEATKHSTFPVNTSKCVFSRQHIRNRNLTTCTTEVIIVRP
jgi:hypothetical protein